MWTSEWFYIDDVALSDPVRQGIPEYSSAVPVKHYNWCPKGSRFQDSSEVAALAKQIKALVKSGLTMVEVVAGIIARRVQPLQQRVHPLWEFNGENDSTRIITDPFANQRALASVLADLFKGKEREFTAMWPREDFASFSQCQW